MLAFAFFGPLADSSPAAGEAAYNLTRLVAEAELIVAGKVVRVTDGVSLQGLPYTEVTLAVMQCPKGGLNSGARHTFRQFGLVAPRRMPDGTLLRQLRPDGHPAWQEGEEVIAFLQAPARKTGLLTTVGLAQGKFTSTGGLASNEVGNRRLFEGVTIRADLLRPEDKSMLAAKGPVPTSTFVALLGRAVRERWIESGRMR